MKYFRSQGFYWKTMTHIINPPVESNEKDEYIIGEIMLFHFYTTKNVRIESNTFISKS